MDEDTKKIKVCLMKMMMEHPFFGRIASEMNWKAVEDLPTAATDFKNIYYNPKFFAKLKQSEAIFVIAHEIMHCVYDHFNRKAHRDHEYWNMAGDYAINVMLEDESIGTVPQVTRELVDEMMEEYSQFMESFKDYVDNAVEDEEELTGIKEKIPEEYKKIMDEMESRIGGPLVLLDENYRGWTSEEIYQDLVKNNAGKKQTFDSHEYGDMEDDSDSDSDSDGDGDGDGDEDSKDAQGNGGKKQNKTRNKQKDFEKRKREFTKLIREARQYAKMQGNMPGSIEEMIEELLEPKIDWRELLAANIIANFKNDRTWERPNRRRIDRRTILPSAAQDQVVDICVAIDTSGSISNDMLLDFVSEVAGILEVYCMFKLKIWCFDTEVTTFQEYDFETVNLIKEPGEVKLKGRGGTDIGATWRFMRENNIKPNQLIVFTDAYDDFSDCDSSYTKTTWIVHSNKKPQIPFGEWALYERDE